MQLTSRQPIVSDTLVDKNDFSLIAKQAISLW